MWFSYDIRDAASDNPTLQPYYVTTPASTSYTAFSRSLAESTSQARQGLSFGASGERGGKTVPALGVKLVQTAASSITRMYSLEADMEAIETGRLVQ